MTSPLEKSICEPSAHRWHVKPRDEKLPRQAGREEKGAGLSLWGVLAPKEVRPS